METVFRSVLSRVMLGSSVCVAVLVTLGCTTMGGGEPFLASPTHGRVEAMGGNSTGRLIAMSDEVGGYFDVMDHWWPANSGFGLHVHDRHDEFFYVLEGTVNVTIGDRTAVGTPGSFFYAPRGVPHSGMDATGEGFKMLLMYAPSFGDGMNEWFDALAALDPEAPDFGEQVTTTLKRVGGTWRVES